MKTIRILPASFAFALLAACSQTPAYERPDMEVPAAFREQPGVKVPVTIAREWWRSFGGAELNTFMDQAIKANHDLEAGVERIEQARAALKIAGAEWVPSADFSGDISQSRSNPARGRASNDTGFAGRVSVAYELDLFGANKSQTEAARAGLMAAAFDHESLKLVVMGDVARTYFTILNLRERIQVAGKNLATARELMSVVNARFEAGTSSALEVSRQKTAVSNAQAAQQSLVQQMKVAENALAVLTGRPPQSIFVKGQALKSLNVPQVSAGQPSALITRRPDLRSAEALLMQANANIGVARAAYFPKITLGLDASRSSSGLSGPAASALALTSGLTQPIFEGGRLEGGVEQATARQRELVAQYRKSVLVSFQEVENALAAVNAAREREKSFGAAAKSAQEAYRISRQRYDAGIEDFENLLAAQTDLLRAEDNYAQSQADRLTSSVDLFKALGGGWV